MPTIERPLVFFRSSISRGAPQGAVDRAAQTIKGFSVLCRAEAMGHDLWIDGDMLDAVVKAGNAMSRRNLRTGTWPIT